MGARRSTPRQEVYKSFDAFYTEPQHLEVQLPAPLAAPLAKNSARRTANCTANLAGRHGVKSCVSARKSNILKLPENSRLLKWPVTEALDRTWILRILKGHIQSRKSSRKAHCRECESSEEVDSLRVLREKWPREALVENLFIESEVSPVTFVFAS
jgi:hypothetical protein